MLVADSPGRFESCICDSAHLVSPQTLSHQECTPPNLRLKLAALLSKEALCCLMVGTSAAA